MDSAVIFDMNETFMREDDMKEVWKEEAPELIHYLSASGYRIFAVNCPMMEKAKEYFHELGLLEYVSGFYDRGAFLPSEVTDSSTGILVGGTGSKLSEMGCMTICIGDLSSEDGADVFLERPIQLKSYLEAIREGVQYEREGDTLHIQ
ncbi:hypothetical protein Q0N12_03990 [Rossellomorea marisflavi]|uniref:hypothetical protein n=1 Tax=Rossellomorea marisflavi TaxID=189381 RepID=UPI00345A0AE5